MHSDPHERHNLAARPEHAQLVAGMRAEIEARFRPRQLHAQVLASQKRRRLVDAAMRQGKWTSWDHQPSTDASTAYVRSQLVLDDIDTKKRWPRT